MFDFLTQLNLTALMCTATFVVGVVFSQKIKDWFTGVPGELRTALKGIELSAKAKLSQASADVLAQITPLAVKPTAPVAPIAPVVPVAPAPPVPAAPAA